MNFSFDLSGAAMTGNVSPDALMGMTKIFGTISGGLAIVLAIVYLAIMVLMLISRWRVFVKAGLPGWGIFIPVYNIILMFKVGGLSGRWILSILFPPLLFIMIIVNCFRIPKRFGKPGIFGLGILLVSIVFVPILAFDKSTYTIEQKPI